MKEYQSLLINYNNAAPVVKYQHIDNTTALFYVINVSNISLLFVDAFDELTDKITPSVSNMRISYSLLYVCCKFHNNILNDRHDIANLMYCWGILIWPTLYTSFHTLNLKSSEASHESIVTKLLNCY